jgi:AraC family ethanolamine operon transcriptional activator
MNAGLKEQVPIGYCTDSSFELFEQLSEAINDWELDFRQLGAVNSPFQLQQLSTPRMLYTQGALDGHFYQRGGPTVGFRTFALNNYNGSDYQWCGERADFNNLVVMPKGGEFESVSRPGFDVFTLSLSTALLERTAELQFQRPLAEFMGPGGEVRYRPGSALRELRKVLHTFSQAVGQGRDCVVAQYGAGGLSRMERKLAHLVLSCLERGDAQPTRPPRSKRMIALNRAMDVIEHTPPPQLCMASLVEQAGVSRRTLEYAFQDSLGLSPANYIKALKLRALHKELLTGETCFASVAGLSAQHGFSHAGQLAVDYRSMFGELPSATLRRSRGNR